MSILTTLFGEGRDLNMLQICDRGLVIFLATLVLIRISGRRSFGIRTPLDNIVVVLLGAIMSRAIVGASPFAATLAVSLLLVCVHRALAWGIANSKAFSRLVEGNRIVLFEQGNFNKRNMQKALVCEEDVLQGVRESALTEDMDRIDKVYMERNGEISAIRKQV